MEPDSTPGHYLAKNWPEDCRFLDQRFRGGPLPHLGRLSYCYVRTSWGAFKNSLWKKIVYTSRSKFSAAFPGTNKPSTFFFLL